MNSIDRVMATIQGTDKDCIPLSLTLSLYGAALTNCPLDEYYTDSKKYVSGQLKVLMKLNPILFFLLLLFHYLVRHLEVKSEF